MRYLLDSNIWIEVLKGKNFRLVARFTETPIDGLVSCSPVRALQIAAIALVHGLTVVTGNVNEFSRVHGLNVEDWSQIGA